MTITSIQNSTENEAALKRIEQLFDAEANSPEAEELETLVSLVMAFEKEHYPIDAPDPVAAIRFRMQQLL